MTTFRWLGNSDIIRQIREADPTQMALWVLGPPNLAPTALPGLLVANYKSFAKFQADVEAKTIASAYRWVMYDPESWDWTPANEAADPWTWLPRFGQYAHAHGYRLITAPARDLGNVKDSVHPMQSGDLNSWYLGYDLAAVAASHADIIDIQAQALSEDVAKYAWFVEHAADQARTANPYVQVLAGVSTRYGTAQQMAAAARSVTVDGYWLNVPGPDPDIGKAVEFLQLMTGGTT